ATHGRRGVVGAAQGCLALHHRSGAARALQAAELALECAKRRAQRIERGLLGLVVLLVAIQAAVAGLGIESRQLGGHVVGVVTVKSRHVWYPLIRSEEHTSE